MMGGVSPETCWASYKYGIIKFWYIVASCWIFLHELDGSCQYNDGRQAVAFQLDTKSYTGQQNLTYSLQRIKEIEMDTRFLNWKVSIAKDQFYGKQQVSFERFTYKKMTENIKDI